MDEGWLLSELIEILGEGYFRQYLARGDGGIITFPGPDVLDEFNSVAVWLCGREYAPENALTYRSAYRMQISRGDIV